LTIILNNQMHRYLNNLLLVLFLATYSLYAQVYNNNPYITNLKALPRGQKMEIRYDLVHAKFYQTFNIDLYVSLDGGQNFMGPLKMVDGDVGDSIQEGRSKIITWDVYREIPYFTGKNVRFELQTETIEAELERNFYAGYMASSRAPIGLVFGLVGKTGFYLSASLNPGEFIDWEWPVGNGGFITHYPDDGFYEYTGETKFQRLSITGGLSFQLGWKTHLYLGVGYYQCNSLWRIREKEYPDEISGYSWIKNTDDSFESLEVEGGLLFDFKHFFLRVGVAYPTLDEQSKMNDYQWIEPAAAVGITF